LTVAQFYAEIKGNRGPASRMGGKESGIWGHIRGWHVGARVECHYDEKTDTDIVRVYATKGSSGGGRETLIATIYENGAVQFAAGVEENFGITLHPAPEPKKKAVEAEA
jgi:hypothetical protein